MKRNITIAIAVGALACAGASTASAQEVERPSYLRAPVRAPRNAFEIGVDTGYTQGFGNISRGVGVGSVGNAGLGIGLGLGYRATPYTSVGWHGTFQELNPADRLTRGTNVRGVATSVDVGAHFAPYERIDPYLNVGTGYRMLWILPEGPNNNVLMHGFELGKLRAGLDVRVNRDIAVGPFIGADVNLFVWRNPEGPAGNQEIADKRINTFVYAGVGGRFDVGGYREPKPGTLMGRR